MAADAYRLKLRHARRPLIEALGIGVRDAELGFAQSRGDVRMRACIDVRVDAQRHRRAAHEAARNVRDALELASDPTVKQPTPRLSAKSISASVLPTTEKSGLPATPPAARPP